MLILSYQPTWFRGSPYGVQPEDGLTKKLLENADEETKMLLGVGGYTAVVIAAAQVPSREYFSGGKEHVETGAHKEQATK